MDTALLISPDGTLAASPPAVSVPPLAPSPGQAQGGTSLAPSVLGSCALAPLPLEGRMAFALPVEGRLVGNPVLTADGILGRMVFVARMVAASR